jgi:hypothetical protein
MQIKHNLDFHGDKLVLLMDLDFDAERGVYCKEWQLLQHQEPKEYDVRLLPADDLIQLAKEIEAAISLNQSVKSHFAVQWARVNH